MIISTTTLDSSAGIDVIFGYAISDLINGAMDVAANKAELFPDEFDNLTLTDDDKTYIERFLKNVSAQVFTGVARYANQVTDAYQYDVDGGSGVADYSGTTSTNVPASDYIRFEFIQHFLGDPNLFTIIDNHFSNAMMLGVVIDWFKLRIKNEVLTHLQEEYDSHIAAIKANFDKRISPIRRFGAFV